MAKRGVSSWYQNHKNAVNRKVLTLRFYYDLILILIVAVVSVNQLRLIKRYMTTDQVMHGKLDYDEFRRMNLSQEMVQKLVEDKEDYEAYLAYEMISKQYNLKQTKTVDEEVWKQIAKVEDTEVFSEIYYYYKMIFQDLKYFPVPEQQTGERRVAFDDSWGAARNYGGERQHEGTDIMADENTRGFFPIVSVSDGVIDKKGWLPQGGYRLFIQAPGGTYFYYAHLYDYAPGLEEGDQIKAGQLLGFMGDSGYGEEGTIGQFDVHLHFGMYINSKEGEMSINPYPILKYLEQKKLTFDY